MVRNILRTQRPDWQLITPGLLLLCAFAVPAAMLLGGQGEPAFNGVDTIWQAYSFTLHSPFWDDVNAVLNWAGYVGVLIFHALLAVFLLVFQRPMTAVFAAASGISVLAVTQLAKAVVGRSRPEGAEVLTDTGSYPSGHVSATTAFLMVLVFLIGRWWINVLAVLGVVVMMINRTYLSAHWLSDVLGGAYLAAGVVLLMWWRFRKICLMENAARKPLRRAKASRRLQAGERAE
ncbi:undecaprenyl-diphosphatase [Arthrobacter sp. cf158]|uniref:phosphatase PAP2 family protein n=1 Tax=Arthrobacter sp. cf158 TaxID=1761744 RepID=UPI000895E250|nr:phosphatase PAP2 family protein [Arthrobacter sp. cf158]SDX00612.1 undecaprenyl-diphosphatase [Arthrobacter sp. cf158]